MSLRVLVVYKTFTGLVVIKRNNRLFKRFAMSPEMRRGCSFFFCHTLKGVLSEVEKGKRTREYVSYVWQLKYQLRRHVNAGPLRIIRRLVSYEFISCL